MMDTSIEAQRLSLSVRQGITSLLAVQKDSYIQLPNSLERIRLLRCRAFLLSLISGMVLCNESLTEQQDRSRSMLQECQL